jgi:2-keto-4-pentenoate hydratase/2-oxohepta-3-ene-1,7-dioic acid hydratase in catechol pathway/uncharacterized protein YciI
MNTPTTDELLRAMLNKPLYVCIRRPADLSLAGDLLDAHLRWAVAAERRGEIFASGPFVADDAAPGTLGGLSIVRAGSEDEARRLLASDPFIRAGVFTLDIRKWLLMEGDSRIARPASRSAAPMDWITVCPANGYVCVASFPSPTQETRMKYQLFAYERLEATGVARNGLAIDGQLVDLAAAAKGLGFDDLATAGVDRIVESWPHYRPRLGDLAGRLAVPGEARHWSLDATRIRYLPPLSRPGMIYAAGANYRDHVEAMGKAFDMKLVLDPKSEGVPPWFFIKAGRGTLAGHRADVEFPGHTHKLDWEAELAVVIGKRASRVRVEDALDHVAGYTCANDLSARDNLVRPMVDPSSPFRFDWIGHKCFTGACPLGPFLTPAEFVASPEDLGIKLWLNGEIRQDSNTSNHLYGVADQISYLSHRLDLFPGDILLTGTPAGVGMERGEFLKRGDVLRVAIDGLGELETRIS